MKTIKSGVAKYRVLLTKKITQFVIGKLSGNIPATTVNSIEEELHQPEVAAHVEQIIPLSSPVIATYPLPGHLPLYFRRSKAFDKKNLYLLKDVMVSPFSGLAWIDEKRFIVESMGSLYRIIGWDNVLHEPLLDQGNLEEEEIIVSCPDNPFYHWVFESLVNVLITLETIPAAKVMVSDKCPAYCRDVLKLLFDEETYNSRVVVADEVKRVSRFVIIQQEQDAGFVHPVAIEALQRFRDKVLQQTTPLSAPTPFIYVSRSKTKNRSLANEQELEAALRKLGFTIIYSENLTLPEQIVLFSQASCIIAPHGAGLSNLVWARQKGSLLEIFAHNHFNDCFARLASTLGFKYRYTQAEYAPDSCGQVQVSQVVALAQKMLSEDAAKHQHVA